MRILCVATKPPWPPSDGGRLALWLTLQGLAEAGHHIVLVTPGHATAAVDPAVALALREVCTPYILPIAGRGWLGAATEAFIHRRALTVARHHRVEVERAVDERIAAWCPDLVHAEQLQAMPNCAPAFAAGIPVVLRMQNVESSLWRQVALASPGARPLLLEARRLRADESRWMARADRVIALTRRDADELRGIGAGDNPGKIVALSPPFPAQLQPGPRVDGDPAVVVAGSGGWWPNREGRNWFIERVLPLLRAAEPAARTHIYGGIATEPLASALVDRSAIVRHPAPADAATAFPAGSIVAIPLHIGSGIRMRILEAWARGLPVVATTAAAAGLEVESGRELLLADTPEGFVAAIQRVVTDPACRAALVARGRAYLARHHDSRILTLKLLTEYAAALENVRR